MKLIENRRKIMRLFTALMFILLVVVPCKAASDQGPVVLGPNNQGYTGHFPVEEDYFPPASEPYHAPEAPVPLDAATAPKTTVKPFVDRTAESPMKYKYQVETPGRVIPPSYNTPQTAPSYGPTIGLPSSSSSREALEQTANKCDAEVAQIWSQQARLDPTRRGIFQRTVGQAKVKCDKLKELDKAIKQADEELLLYRQDMDNAQRALIQ